MEHTDSPEKMCKSKWIDTIVKCIFSHFLFRFLSIFFFLQNPESKGKLYFSSHNSHRILKAHGLDSIDRVEVVPNPKQAIRKANNNTRQTQYQRATNKFSRRVTQAAKQQPFSTGRTSLQGCTQKAIAFSQGQIRDFQYVAAKLTKELKSMRQITKRCLLAESNPSNMPECNLDEVLLSFKPNEVLVFNVLTSLLFSQNNFLITGYLLSGENFDWKSRKNWRE